MGATVCPFRVLIDNTADEYQNTERRDVSTFQMDCQYIDLAAISPVTHEDQNKRASNDPRQSTARNAAVFATAKWRS